MIAMIVSYKYTHNISNGEAFIIEELADILCRYSCIYQDAGVLATYIVTITAASTAQAAKIQTHMLSNS